MKIQPAKIIGAIANTIKKKTVGLAYMDFKRAKCQLLEKAETNEKKHLFKNLLIEYGGFPCKECPFYKNEMCPALRLIFDQKADVKERHGRKTNAELATIWGVSKRQIAKARKIGWDGISTYSYI